MEPLRSLNLSSEIAGIDRISIQRVTRESKQATEDVVAREIPLTIIFNNQELVTLLCSPGDLNSLAAGFLFSEGLVDSREDIKRILVDEEKGIARVETVEDRDMPAEILFKRMITSGCGRGASFYSAADAHSLNEIKTETRVLAGDILDLVRGFQPHSELFRATGAVHSAALCDAKQILVFSEDIGRHNAIDKVFGRCLLEGIRTEGRMIITSGRVSSEVVAKVVRRNIPLLISKSAPTNIAIKLANDLGLTLVGFARGQRMNIYTHDRRIVMADSQEKSVEESQTGNRPGL